MTNEILEYLNELIEDYSTYFFDENIERDKKVVDYMKELSVDEEIRLNDNLTYTLFSVECEDCHNTAYGISRYGRELPDNWTNYTHGDYIICDNCIDYDYYICNGCDRYTYIDEVTNADDGDTCYCESCRNRYCFYCEDCNGYYTSNDVNSYVVNEGYDNERIVCESCLDNGDYRYCDNCGGRFDYDRLSEGNYDAMLCGNCREDEQGRLINIVEVSTGELEPLTKEHFLQFYDENINNGYIEEYHSYHRDFKKKKLDNETGDYLRYFGVELEVENYGDYKKSVVASYLRKYLDVICASDGSLNNGFEIISDPMTLNYWLLTDNLKKWKMALELLSDLNFKSHNTSTCGLHIHISKDGAINGDLDDEKVQALVDRLELIFANFKSEIETLSRRVSGGYNRYLSRSVDTHYSLDEIKKHKSYNDHYDAINCGHSNTIEFRNFKGTLKFNSFIGAIQFINNLIDMANSDYVGKTFRQLININKYDELTTYYNELNIVSKTKIKDHTTSYKSKLLKKENIFRKKAERTNKLVSEILSFIDRNIKDVIIINNLSNMGIITTEYENTLKIKNTYNLYRNLVNYINYEKSQYYTNEREYIYYFSNENMKKTKECYEQFKNNVKELKKGGVL